jgi:Ca2+-binding RTX toxin-like protein
MAINSTLLPQTAFINLERNDDSYWQIKISDGSDLNGVYDGWCIDWDHNGKNGIANIYSSYQDLSQNVTNRIKEENLDLVNWIFNQNWGEISSVEGNGYSAKEIQKAVWTLIDDGQTLYPKTYDRDALEIINLARQNGEGFVPDENDKVVLIFEPQNGGQVVITTPFRTDLFDHPALDLEKLVSVDGGNTWFDADEATGPNALATSFNPIFKFLVTNTGDVDLKSITLSDSYLDLNGSLEGTSLNIESLGVGKTFETYISAPWQLGQQTHTATVTTDYTNIVNQTFTVGDQDAVNYFGVAPNTPAENITPLPHIDFSLKVGSDSYFDVNIINGGFLTGSDYDAWCVDADTLISMNQVYTGLVYSSYDTIPSGLVERPENLDLVNWILNQDFVSKGYSKNDVKLAIWDLVESDRPTSDIKAKEIVDQAIKEGEGYTPTPEGKIGLIINPIDNIGNNIAQVIITPIPITPIADEPSLDLEKYVSINGGQTWQDADSLTGEYLAHNTFDPQFKFVVTNTGNVDLRNITLADSDFDLNGIAEGTSLNLDYLAKGATYELNLTAPWQEGQHTNTAVVSTTYQNLVNQTLVVKDQDSANYFGAKAEIDVEKYISIDDGQTWLDADDATGPGISSCTKPQFKFVVKNIGNVDLSNVTLDDNRFRLDGLTGDTVKGDCTYTIDSLAIGDSVEVFYKGTWEKGQHTNIATTSGTYTDSNGNITITTDQDNANYFGVAPIKGTKKDDLLEGSKFDDKICGYKGNDRLYGYDGNDKIYGDQGNDKLYGGSGDDLLDGGSGNDYLIGGEGNDTLTGGSGRDIFAFNSLFHGGVDIITDLGCSDIIQIDTSTFLDDTQFSGISVSKRDFTFCDESLFYQGQQFAILENTHSFNVRNQIQLV